MDFRSMKITLTVGEVLDLAQGKKDITKLKAYLFDIIVKQTEAFTETKTVNKEMPPSKKQQAAVVAPPEETTAEENDVFEEDDMEDETAEEIEEVPVVKKPIAAKQTPVVSGNLAVDMLLNKVSPGGSKFSDSKKPVVTNEEDEDEEDDEDEAPVRRRVAPPRTPRGQSVPASRASNPDLDRLQKINNQYLRNSAGIPGLRGEE